jgi:hypothetical protein
MPLQRDPVSVQFDAAAARLIRRADRNRGQWAGTYVANPSAEWMLWARRRGIRLLGPDTAGGGQARTRWCRGFVRSVYYLHKHYFYEGKGLDLTDRRASGFGPRSLQFQVGTVKLNPLGIVVGRAVRIRFVEGGSKAMRAVAELPVSQRIYDDDGNPGGRFSSPADRDW